MHYSFYDNNCVQPYLADCTLDYIKCQQSRELGIPVFLSNSRDCRSYFLCIGDTSVALQCAPGQHFVPERNWCDSPEEANCTVKLISPWYEKKKLYSIFSAVNSRGHSTNPWPSFHRWLLRRIRKIASSSGIMWILLLLCQRQFVFAGLRSWTDIRSDYRKMRNATKRLLSSIDNTSTNSVCLVC